MSGTAEVVHNCRMVTITFKTEVTINVDQFIEQLTRSIHGDQSRSDVMEWDDLRSQVYDVHYVGERTEYDHDLDITD